MSKYYFEREKICFGDIRIFVLCITTLMFISPLLFLLLKFSYDSTYSKGSEQRDEVGCRSSNSKSTSCNHKAYLGEMPNFLQQIVLKWFTKEPLGKKKLHKLTQLKYKVCLETCSHTVKVYTFGCACSIYKEFQMMTLLQQR